MHGFYRKYDIFNQKGWEKKAAAFTFVCVTFGCLKADAEWGGNAPIHILVAVTDSCQKGAGPPLCCLIPSFPTVLRYSLSSLCLSSRLSAMTSGIAQSIILWVHVSRLYDYHTAVSISELSPLLVCVVCRCLITGLSISSAIPSSSGRAARGKQDEEESHWWL